MEPTVDIPVNQPESEPNVLAGVTVSGTFMGQEVPANYYRATQEYATLTAVGGSSFTSGESMGSVESFRIADGVPPAINTNGGGNVTIDAGWNSFIQVDEMKSDDIFMATCADGSYWLAAKVDSAYQILYVNTEGTKTNTNQVITGTFWSITAQSSSYCVVSYLNASDEQKVAFCTIDATYESDAVNGVGTERGVAMIFREDALLPCVVVSYGSNGTYITAYKTSENVVTISSTVIYGVSNAFVTNGVWIGTSIWFLMVIGGVVAKMVQIHPNGPEMGVTATSVAIAMTESVSLNPQCLVVQDGAMELFGYTDSDTYRLDMEGYVTKYSGKRDGSWGYYQDQIFYLEGQEMYRLMGSFAKFPLVPSGNTGTASLISTGKTMGFVWGDMNGMFAGYGSGQMVQEGPPPPFDTATSTNAPGLSAVTYGSIIGAAVVFIVIMVIIIMFA